MPPLPNRQKRRRERNKVLLEEFSLFNGLAPFSSEFRHHPISQNQFRSSLLKCFSKVSRANRYLRCRQEVPSPHGPSSFFKRDRDCLKFYHTCLTSSYAETLRQKHFKLFSLQDFRLTSSCCILSPTALTEASD